MNKQRNFKCIPLTMQGHKNRPEKVRPVIETGKAEEFPICINNLIGKTYERIF